MIVAGILADLVKIGVSAIVAATVTFLVTRWWQGRVAK